MLNSFSKILFNKLLMNSLPPTEDFVLILADTAYLYALGDLKDDKYMVVTDHSFSTEVEYFIVITSIAIVCLSLCGEITWSKDSKNLSRDVAEVFSLIFAIAAPTLAYVNRWITACGVNSYLKRREGQDLTLYTSEDSLKKFLSLIVRNYTLSNYKPCSPRTMNVYKFHLKEVTL